MPPAGPANTSWKSEKGTTGLQPSSKLSMHRRAGCQAIGFLDECTNPIQGPGGTAILPSPCGGRARHSASEFTCRDHPARLRAPAGVRRGCCWPGVLLSMTGSSRCCPPQCPPGFRVSRDRVGHFMIRRSGLRRCPSHRACWLVSRSITVPCLPSDPNELSLTRRSSRAPSARPLGGPVHD